MKGKIAFVVGAAVGYVLGTRAGRERYEQIKRGAESVWNTEPVQRGVGAVRGAVRGKVDDVRDSVLRAGKQAFAAMVQSTPDRPTAGPGQASSATRNAASSGSATTGPGAGTAAADEQGGTA